MAVAGQNTRRRPARPENYCESKQTYFSYILDKAFHLPEFQAKLFFTRDSLFTVNRRCSREHRRGSLSSLISI